MKYIICICDECSHAWLASGESPARCAKCKSSQWDGQEKRERGRPKKFAPVQLEEDGDELVAPKRPKVKRQTVADHPAIERLIEEGSVTRGMNEAIDKTLSLACPHKKKKGELCYKCDAKFGVPKIKTGA